MKKQLIVLVILLSALITGNCFAQGVGINNPAPDASAMLDVNSTNKGMLTPRMTSAQRLAIVAPATGLIVYETTTSQFFYFDGTVWKPFSSATSGWNVIGNTGTTAAANFLGTTDNVDLVVKTNNVENMRVTSGGNVGVGTSNPIQKFDVAGINSPAASSGIGANGIARFQPAGTSLTMDMGGSGAFPSHGWLQVRDNTSYTINYNLSLNPNGGNVGVGTISPSAKLSVARVGGIDDVLTLSDTQSSLVVGTDFDLPGFMRIRPTSGTGIGITNNGDAIGLFVKSDASANVGIGTSSPLSKLHVAGNIRMVDGNQANGRVMTSDVNGVGTWQDAKITKYFAVSGTSIATAPVGFAAMPQMSIAFTPKGNLAFVRFNAAGANANTCGQNSINFQVLVNTTVVLTTQTSIEDISNSTVKIWDLNIEIPVTVTPNAKTVLQKQMSNENEIFEKTIDISQLPAGMYMMRVSNETDISLKRFIKN